jgi:flagellar hook-associated protein FlgK
MATLRGKYTSDELKDERERGVCGLKGPSGCRYWSIGYTVRYTDVYDATLSRYIQIAYEGCGSTNYAISFDENDVKTIYTVPQLTNLSEALKSIGFVFQFCTHPNYPINGVLPQNSCQPEVHIINYECDETLKKQEELHQITLKNQEELHQKALKNQEELHQIALKQRDDLNKQDKRHLKALKKQDELLQKTLKDKDELLKKDKELKENYKRHQEALKQDAEYKLYFLGQK